MQRGGALRRKQRIFCMVMMFNVFICIALGVSWNLRRCRSGCQKVHVPFERFWQQQGQTASFWNKEQQRLDFIYNPLVNSVLTERPDWLNGSGPPDPCEPDYRVPMQILDYNSLPQRFHDFLLHIRCRTYPMLINQLHICDRDPFLLLVVKSLIPHFDRRQAIRETWGRTGIVSNRTVVTVFLLGNPLLTDHVPELQGMLGYEAELHKDLLQWDYRDTFFNLTLKEVLFLEWFSQNCPNAQYVLKGDDDVFVNTLRIIKFLEDLPENEAKDFFVGDVISDASPQRDKKLKYFIPESVFAFMHVLEHECQHHHSKTKKHSKKSKKHHRKRSRSRSVSESEDEEYHKKKKRSQSKSPSEHSSSGESERSYKKSKKHKKKAKKRRHKSASPDSDNEKKGRERDGRRERDVEKDKENDKSRGKSRSDSKQKSPKRKAAREEGGWDTSGSELSEGELEKRRRTLLEQLDAP